MYKLHCVVQNYLWGKAGHNSRVALLKAADDATYQVSDEKHYAEYWFGTHPSGPSSIEINGQIIPLKEYLNDHPELVGSTMSKNGDLPFLYKVLSVGAALSIQAHPDKKLAEQLHASNPKAYTDDNHKPEMALALGPFEAMCGFRSLQEICDNLKSCDALYKLIGKETADKFIDQVTSHKVDNEKTLLKELFSHFIECSKELAAECLAEHKNVLLHKETRTQMENTILEVMDTYPGDAGAFALYILNYLELNKGDSIYLGANIPHAYLKGDIMESMACSNNVVRAGLTPKFIDKEVLINMCTYENGPVHVNKGESIDTYTRLYTTPAPEFEIEYTHLPANTSYQLRTPNVPSICVVTSGIATSVSSNGEMSIKEGSILFHAANMPVTITTMESSIDIYTTHEKL